MQRNARKECSPGGKTGNTFISTPPSESALRETQTHLKSPEPSNVAASLEADGLQPLVQAAFNGAQSTNASSNNCNPLLCHAVWPQRALPATWEKGILRPYPCWCSSELKEWQSLAGSERRSSLHQGHSLIGLSEAISSGAGRIRAGVGPLLGFSLAVNAAWLSCIIK